MRQVILLANIMKIAWAEGGAAVELDNMAGLSGERFLHFVIMWQRGAVQQGRLNGKGNLGRKRVICS